MSNVNKELNMEELEQVSAGYLGFLLPIVKKVGTEVVKKIVPQEKRVTEVEMLADIRMRASENALKAAMRLDKQEADIKEAMKAQREALGLN